MSEPPPSLFYFFAFNWDRKQIPKFVNKMSLELQFKCMESLSLLVGCSFQIFSLQMIFSTELLFPYYYFSQFYTDFNLISPLIFFLLTGSRKNEFHGWTDILVCLQLLSVCSYYYTYLRYRWICFAGIPSQCWSLALLLPCCLWFLPNKKSQLPRPLPCSHAGTLCSSALHARSLRFYKSSLSPQNVPGTTEKQTRAPFRPFRHVSV